MECPRSHNTNRTMHDGQVFAKYDTDKSNDLDANELKVTATSTQREMEAQAVRERGWRRGVGGRQGTQLFTVGIDVDPNTGLSAGGDGRLVQ